MHLLQRNDQGGLTLTRDSEYEAYPYGILSHTWGHPEEEVTFDDMKRGVGKEKAGYAKIDFCAERAKANDLKHFWIDSCCIDRSNSVQLSESINSMFRWYKAAAKCFVYLQDVSTLKRDSDGGSSGWETAFRKSRWFKRGWTLQELLAPRVVEFYSRDGKFLGTKETLRDMVHQITGIPVSALLGAELSSFSTNERFRWAAGRETTKREDKAYCLFGVFDVFLSPIYGEGAKAYDRLKDEVSGISDSRQDDASPSASLEDVAQRRGNLLASLDFEQIDARHDTIKTAQETTCKWLLKHPKYQAWIDPEASSTSRGILWIAGKPGAGKSTLMKFALARAVENKLEKEIIVSFFFNARGDELEKTTLGMYRSILHQLLHEIPDLQRILDRVGSPRRNDTRPFVWDVQKLQDLLSTAAGELGDRSLKIFVDALDECDVEQVRGMVNFLEDLGDAENGHGSRLRVCFASRHYPTIEIDYGWRLVLEEEAGHANDLGKYIQRRLKRKSKLADDVRQEVQEKANSVFLWVVLVVDILSDDFSNGRLLHVRKKLREMPGTLNDLFKDIIYRDQKDMRELLLCLTWILFAKCPLSPEELYFVMETGLECERDTHANWEPTPWNHEEVFSEDMARFTQSSSKGLAEITKSKKAPTVQFIHESVRDFLVRDGGLRELWPDLGGEMISSSHEKLKKCCKAYLAADISSCSDPTQPLPKASSDEAKIQRKMISDRYPFMQYAFQNVFFHADKAALHVPQDSFLDDFPLDKWVHIANASESHATRQYSPRVSLLYILAEKGCTRLIEARGTSDAWVRLPKERYSLPALAAFSNGHKDALRVLLGPSGSDFVDDIANDSGFGKPSQIRGLRDILRSVAGNVSLVKYLITTCPNQELCPLSSVSKSATGREFLVEAARRGDSTLVRELLERGVDVNAQNKSSSALYIAIKNGHDEVIKQLLEGGANVNASGPYGSALHIAIEIGSREVIKQLLERGANVDSPGPHGSALHIAVGNGSCEIVKQLLERGANVDSPGPKGSALHIAVENGSREIVKQLLEIGADVNAQGGYFGNALYVASHNGYSEVVKQLLERGANVNTQGGHYGNALCAASNSGYSEVVKQLLERGANINTQGGHYGNALCAASHSGHSEVVKQLLERGANVNAQGGYFGNALCAASAGGYGEVVIQLLEKVANVNAQGLFGNALSTAKHFSRHNVVRLLEELGRSIEDDRPEDRVARELQAPDRQTTASNILSMFDEPTNAGGIEGHSSGCHFSDFASEHGEWETSQPFDFMEGEGATGGASAEELFDEMGFET
ncbi:hypothetical protein MBLNU230_g5737t1 [Neophaeotheca triangularis]